METSRMEPAANFNVQGHCGARGLKPENTLPSFEVAFDCGVSSVETDVHLSCDGVPVLMHDHCLTEGIYRAAAKADKPSAGKPPLVSQLSLAQLRCCIADLNPDASRFPGQEAVATPLASWFTESRGIHPFAIPTLADLFAFADAYAQEPGRRAGKTDEQRGRARQILFDLELKRIPFHPETIGDKATPGSAGLLERQVLKDVRNADVLSRTIVRSFDHRFVRALKLLEPALKTAVIVAGTAPVEPAELAQRALAQVYCPDYLFLDQEQIRQLRQAGIQVMPWTVNDPADWERLYEWGVNGTTTDYPNRLIEWLRQKRR